MWSIKEMLLEFNEAFSIYFLVNKGFSGFLINKCAWQTYKEGLWYLAFSKFN